MQTSIKNKRRLLIKRREKSTKGSDCIFEHDIMKMARCCSCNKPMKESKNVNGILLNKLATWEYPTWDNLLLKEGIPRIKCAAAVVCDDCVEKKKMPQVAIEIRGKNVIYHDILTLEDVFEIKENMLKEYP